MTTQTQTTRPKALHVTLWVAQVALALMFIMTGVMKLAQPIEELAKSLPWASQVPAAFVRFIGLSELLGGLGLILPAAFRIKPVLTPWAALGLATIMILASGFHLSRGESSVIGMNLILAAIALFIAWGRFKKAPIYPK
jgi:putative oxidoreductase